ncbi:MAG TPA: APC family permease [Victivallales bacterium]|nr:APC family permease [Victivallales bacterium]
MKKKKIRLFDIVLMSVCVVIILDAVAPTASIGLSSAFWWIFLLILFFYPYGLVTAELGTTYTDEGGIYDWVKRAFGNKWGARVAWYYWINYAFWMASTGVLFAMFIEQLTGRGLSPLWISIISLVVIWGCVWICMFKASENIWILNIGAICKAFVLVAIGLIGLYIALTKGVANDFSVHNFIPNFNDGMRFLPMIIFNFMGFEIIATVSGDMKNPGKEIPKALIMGGILIAFFYLLSTFGILVAVPVSKLSPSTGILESFYVMLGHGSLATYFICFIGIVFMFTLIANLVSWGGGVNYVSMYAAKNNDLPKIFAAKYKNTDMTLGAGIMNGIVASILILVYYVLAMNGMSGDIFWNLFSLSSITLLMSYILLFPSFSALRKIDPDADRPFKVKGGKIKIFLISYVPMILLILSLILFFYVPGVPFDYSYFYQVGSGLIITIVVNELIIRYLHRKNPLKI